MGTYLGVGIIGLVVAAAGVAVSMMAGASPGAALIGGHVVLGGVLAAVLAGVLKARILAPLETLQAAFNKMYRDGDLSQRVHLGGGPVGVCAERFNDLIESFQGIVGKVIFDADRVAEAADKLSSHAGKVADGSRTQKTESEAMVHSIEEMTAGVNAVAEHAGQTAQNAQQARELSLEGGRIVSEASNEIERIARSVEQSAQVIAALGERSEAISGIVKVIREIADQTNLLALNAAIEAARAGEQGRGFAVVADEVRKLAERTSTATTEISAMIEAIQSETRSAIGAIKAGSDQARSGAELARQAADSLDKINRGATETMEKIDAIAVAITQQSRVADGVVANVREIMTMVERNTEGASATLDEAKRLESLAVNLHEISKVFRLGATGENAMKIHGQMPALAKAAAAKISAALEQAVANKRTDMTALFDRHYEPIPNTKPQKFTSRYDKLADEIFPAIQEPVLSEHPAAVYAIGTDTKAYVPTHNKAFSKPLTGDYEKDFVGNRTKRIFDDPVGRQCGAHELEFLIQTYRRDTGEIFHDVSAPVYVNGKHWGGFRVGYRA
ncbi:methyl-accepting chemotaxis protein [Denitromonas iodatirespirans]|uniref:Methyl-accepting chemotaxis protein n=1 Tax=Denitromonas iodatirespirans TaxID=2795389 RepID=A0A944DC69_DENI1|nr:methyl-accepting chemotaxis protein [Denitromonas iodatirespirans]MBT0963560.1 methyl-accepting chemotaxis protein [Denitromonas iodatirespirans]